LLMQGVVRTEGFPSLVIQVACFRVIQVHLHQTTSHSP
jgi:hypothetical protein